MPLIVTDIDGAAVSRLDELNENEELFATTGTKVRRNTLWACVAYACQCILCRCSHN